MRAVERTGVDYYCQISDVTLLKKLVRDLPDNPVCVNIGAAMGTSALAMLEARPDSIVISIDIEDCPIEKQSIEDCGYDEEDRYWFIKDKSQDVGKDWKKPPIDFVFVDGDHTYEGCYMDAMAWYKHLKPGGIMAFHDYESKIQVLESVKRAVDAVVLVLNLKYILQRGTLIVFRKAKHENIPSPH